ncbi:MAG: AAA family ATPase [Ruminococcus sp.]|nr:AAA family ATPase [Ruminococcus sp.]
MTIKEAKEQIKNSVSAYLEKDEFDTYVIPTEKQRPIFLMGAPGIGKTAIMEQVAEELDIAIVSYSMTHHTRQSALGLPFIVQKNYCGKDFSISEYTMSEIIASVYETIEKSGKKEGILFLDEINCVSETLAPSMLQFLQFKIFGKHKVPEGWIVVTAGNPPEYNKSVREFDIVTWDRLKRIDVEPDLNAWKEYAYKVGVHPSIITYLDIKKTNFYVIESTVDGKSFVTARGWEDLSRIISMYEKKGFEINNALISQYIQHPKISKDFANYYDLFNKYKSDYQTDAILAGKATDDIKQRAISAKFDERLSLIGLIISIITNDAKEVILSEKIFKQNLTIIKQFKDNLGKQKSPAELMQSYVDETTETLETVKASGILSAEQNYRFRKTISMLDNYKKYLEGISDTDEAYNIVKGSYNSHVKKMRTLFDKTSKALSNAFLFFEEIWSSQNEILIFVTELTLNQYTAEFIGKFGCEEYFRHSKELMFYERQKDIISKLELLD